MSTKPALAMGISGRYRLLISSPSRGTRVAAEFDNLILNSGLDRLGVGTAVSYCQVGSGAVAPAVTDTALQTFVASSNTTGPNNGTATYTAGPPDYIEYLLVRRFNPGVATGTLAEVGFGWSASTGSLFSRALILDGGGSPTTITVLSDETLDVEYRLRVYPPASDVTGSISISGSSYDYVIRPSGVSTNYATSPAWNPSVLFSTASISGIRNTTDAKVYGAGATLGARTSPPTGGIGGATSIAGATYTETAYSTGSYKRTCKISVPISAGNVSGGIQCMVFGFQSSNSANSYGAGFQISFNPAIPKDNTKVFEVTFDFSWARR